MITISHSQSSIADSFCYNVQSYLVVHSRQFLHTVQSHLVDHSRQFHLQYQVILAVYSKKILLHWKVILRFFADCIHIFIADSSFSLHSQVIYHAPSIYTAKLYSYRVVILQKIHLHYQVIHGCHIANNPFTLSSDNRTRVVLLQTILYTIKSYMVVILRTIHLHCQVILVQGCHIAKNPLTFQAIHGCLIANHPFTLSSDTPTGLSYCKQSIYTTKSYMVVILRTIH